MTMTEDTKPRVAETITQIAASGQYVYILTSTGRVFSAERGRKAMGWVEIPPPEAPAA